MILVRLMGGLGNQMFQYAFGKALALEFGVQLKLDISLLGEDELVENHVVRNYDLDVFNLQEEFATTNEIEKFNGKKNANILDKLLFRLNRISGKYPLVLQQDHEYDLKQISSIGSNACIVGRWQSEDYFKKHAAEIRNAFSFHQFVPNEYSRMIAEQMSKTIAVSVHIRRGDYVTHPVYSQGLGCLDKQYYLDAISLLNKKMPDNNKLKFYFISDDINWCKANFSEVDNAVFVAQEKDRNGYFSDLWLLTQCKHAVISNSTFAWWGAYLIKGADKLVIAPKRWGIADGFCPPRIIPKEWIEI